MGIPDIWSMMFHHQKLWHDYFSAFLNQWFDMIPLFDFHMFWCILRWKKWGNMPKIQVLGFHSDGWGVQTPATACGFWDGSKLGDGGLQDGAGEGLHDTSLIFDAGEFHMFHGIYQDFRIFHGIGWSLCFNLLVLWFCWPFTSWWCYQAGWIAMQKVLGAASQVTNRYSFKDLGHLSLAAPLGNHPSRVISFDPSIHPVGTCSPQFLHQSFSAPRISSYSMNNSIFV